MSIHITYRPLCSAQIWHAYYLHPAEDEGQDWIDPVARPNALQTLALEGLSAAALNAGAYSILNDLRLTPTVPTAAFLQRMKMIFKPQNTGFTILARAQKDSPVSYRPFIPFDQDFKLSFIIQAKNSNFFSFTAIDMPIRPRSVYYFSNLAQNKNGEHSLLLNANPPGAEPPQNYISANDLLPLKTRNISMDIDLPKVRLVFNNPVHQFETSFEKPPAGAETGIFDPPMSHLPSGWYEVKAFTDTGIEIIEFRQNIYWNQGDIPPDALGVIELYHLNGANLEAYAFQDSNNHLQSPIYTLWWQNRSTYWRYLFNKEQPAPDTGNENCHVKPESPNENKRLISKEPQPLLSRYRKISFYPADSPGSGESRLPNPGPGPVYPEETGVYSEIYMGDTQLDKVN
ncbi:MAG: hypothetical protein KDD01_27095 [Phaeodactylibacter sp.]|nr:hypothetical protein [Phaeodactylibacter sp.]